MLRHRTFVLQIFVMLLLSASFFLAPTTSLAQDEMSFEQAQTRAAFARKQMQAKKRELKEAEDREKSALQEVDKLKKRFEEAQQEVENATQARLKAEEDYVQAQQRWSEESERLIRIYENRK
jgi:flagellar motility protein MotE (MotC chaperone)